MTSWRRPITASNESGSRLGNAARFSPKKRGILLNTYDVTFRLAALYDCAGGQRRQAVDCRRRLERAHDRGQPVREIIGCALHEKIGADYRRAACAELAADRQLFVK